MMMVGVVMVPTIIAYRRLDACDACHALYK